MPAWSRTILPIEASWPAFPGPLVSVGASRKPQMRATMQMGREWEETYGVMRRSDNAVAKFLAELNNLWRNGTTFDIDHRAQRALRGAGGGTPVISTGAQTGSTINVTGFPISTANVLRAGDVIRFPGRTLVFDVTADVASDGAGLAAMPINPPIYVGGSPTTGAVLINQTPGTVLYVARIKTYEAPSAGVNEAYMGLRVEFAEVAG